EGKVVRVGSHKDVAPVETQRSIVKLLPAYCASVGELASEWTFRFGVVVDTARIALCFGIGVADRRDQVSLAFRGIDLQGVVLRVCVAAKLCDIRVTEVRALLVG